MGVEPTSSAWKADALAVVLHPQIKTGRPLMKTSGKTKTIITMMQNNQLRYYILDVFVHTAPTLEESSEEPSADVMTSNV